MDITDARAKRWGGVEEYKTLQWLPGPQDTDRFSSETDALAGTSSTREYIHNQWNYHHQRTAKRHNIPSTTFIQISVGGAAESDMEETYAPVLVVCLENVCPTRLARGPVRLIRAVD